MATFIQSILSEFSAQGSIDKGVMVANGNMQAPAMAYHLHVPRIELTVKGTLRMLLPKGVDRIVKYERPVGTITYIPANSWNSPLWESPVICMSIVFWKQDVGFSISNWDGTQFKEVEKYNLQNSSSTVRDRLLDLAESLAWSQDTTSETFAHVVYALLNDLLYQITDGLNNQRAPFSLLDEIKSHIDSHYHTDISRESVAETFNISPGYLSRLFSKESDVKFNEYLKLARISRSKTLLTNTNLKINEVSEKCGFTDTNYFCKVFRDINDCTPLEYRRKNKGARS
ncbi:MULTISPECIES: helix-turn-helix domain-containing protein [Enterobacteriaceae]|jgi:AraC-like DNA-binding protein|uniref:helix-turn-helix domain-containing protein n=1 Tax=Enterobacteriaceae TaxID=543 RepID=UPI0002A2CC6B|nr:MULTISPECIES: AraC family transcriptional regulator [Enterobacteriaceae]EJN1924176.1 helix-turn-helix transcriptional regulator [Salmonella enterica]MBJ9342122.1 helix-turn-helix transcriptional regulator [Citrobacter freundii]MDF2524979.1 AraC family transcriptional regulator [Enterobacter mori]HDR2625973.1 helix-turn-helix transcriptional regulator [Enterobacter cancerogenus]AYW56362.1 AraC family transcriptional regulator [Raoultella ornithinolytica]